MQDIINVHGELSSIPGSRLDHFTMPKKYKSDIQVYEVYELAISIGKEFEQINLHYGNDAISKLIPQVTKALEYLELHADIKEKVRDENIELKKTIDRLQIENAHRSSLKDKYEKELYLLEHTNQVDRDDFQRAIETLQHHNDDLQRSLDQYKRSSTISTCSTDSSIIDNQQDLTRLREVVKRQNDDMRILKRECRQKSVEISGLNKEIDELEMDNASSKHKSFMTLEQTRQLIEDKKELRSQLENKELEILNISTLLSTGSSPRHATSTADQPQFTLNELRDVLAERNALKSMLYDLDTDGDPDSSGTEADAAAASSMSLQGELQTAEDNLRRTAGDNDLPVQGPINKEPRDKINPNGSLMNRLISFLIRAKHRNHINNQRRNS